MQADDRTTATGTPEPIVDTASAVQRYQRYAPPAHGPGSVPSMGIQAMIASPGPPIRQRLPGLASTTMTAPGNGPRPTCPMPGAAVGRSTILPGQLGDPTSSVVVNLGKGKGKHTGGAIVPAVPTSAVTNAEGRVKLVMATKGKGKGKLVAARATGSVRPSVLTGHYVAASYVVFHALPTVWTGDDLDIGVICTFAAAVLATTRSLAEVRWDHEAYLVNLRLNSDAEARAGVPGASTALSIVAPRSLTASPLPAAAVASAVPAAADGAAPAPLGATRQVSIPLCDSGFFVRADMHNTFHG